MVFAFGWRSACSAAIRVVQVSGFIRRGTSGAEAQINGETLPQRYKRCATQEQEHDKD